MLFRKKSIREILDQEDPFVAVNQLMDVLRKSRMTFPQYSQGQRILWTIRMLFSETNNGTIEQWASNSSGDLYQETCESLKTVGADEVVSLIERFNRLIDHKLPLTRDERIDQIGLSKENNPSFEREVRSITNELGDVNRSTYQLMIGFLKKDPTGFDPSR